ncbi:MAG TPA: GNAT family protein [Candidatus Limnocylindrales bacterium]|nr:GNAT family protein [Candidatus Limnocylindrales bacterium]
MSELERPTTAPTLRGERMLLRAVRAEDVPALREVLQEPSVARWWGAPREGVDVADDWLAIDPDTIQWTIEVDGTVAGSIQAAEEDDPDYRHAGLDLFLGPSFQDRGLGRDAIRTVARWLFETRGHHRLTIDPSAANARAIAAYQAVGFRPVGIQRQYERGPDGTFHDGLLLDLLRDELR